MFKEIAIDPIAVATSFREFSYVVEKCGISEGRLIAAFPSKWKRAVFEAAQHHLRGKVELKKIEERLHKLPATSLWFRGRSGDGCREDWLAAAVVEHGRWPFEAIVASKLLDVPGVVAVSDLDGEHSCFQPNRQWHVKREAVSMADCCGPVLSAARHIKLIDPHFDAGATRFRKPFLEFLRRARPGARVDIFRGDREDSGHMVQRLNQALAGMKPEGVEVRLFLRPQEPMHNRFVLSEIGGLTFQIGLDDQDSGSRPTDLVTLLEREPWAIEWQNYQGEDHVGRWL